MDRGRKGQAAFSTLVLSRGSEDVGKTGAERLPEPTGEACRRGED